MKQMSFSGNRTMSVAWSFLFLTGTLFILNACKKTTPPDHQLKNFNQVNLVDNNHHYNAAHMDSTLINAWGIAFNPSGVAWVNSQGGHVSEIYDKEGVILRPPVWVPGATAGAPGNPTGIVFNGTTDFGLSNGKSAKFIFVGVDGILSGWNGGDVALTILNNSSTSAYTGLTMAATDGKNYLYAADFRAGKIVVWDKNYAVVPWTFTDPALPAGYAPYNIQAVGERLYVTFAKVASNGREEFGAGLGYVDIFKTNGDFVKRFASNDVLNAPWGITHAAADFFADNEDEMLSKVSLNNSSGTKDMILIGNFGDGKINAYTTDGHFVGPLKSHGQAIVIPGLWAITFPPATATAVDPNRLYFAAGPDEAKDGLFGYIEKK